MPLAEDNVRLLVTWWTSGSGSGEHLLAEDFVYEGAAERHGKSDFVLGIRNQVEQRDVRLLGVFVGRTQAATFFETLDPTTGLRHRIAWLLEHDGEWVRRLTVVHSILTT